MIVKIKNVGEMWSYFECEIVHSKSCLMEDVAHINEAVIIFEDDSSRKNNKKKVLVLNLETQKSHLRTIITDNVCYILNKEGKTIERI